MDPRQLPQRKRGGKTARAALILGLGLCVAGTAFSADWPGWRGPQRTGISRETGLLKEWPQEGPKLAWQVKNVGYGFGAPAVAGERLYLISNTDPENEIVQALSAKDGRQLWSVRLGKVGNPDQQPSYPGSRSTPIVDGDRLYALGSDGDLVCLETATGKALWKKSLRGEFGGKPGVWAYSESPLVDGDRLICTPGGETATLVALNKKSGEVIWKASVPGGDQAGYASPIVMETGGVKQYVTFVQKGLVGVEAATGKVLWKYEKTAQNSPANIPTPIARGEYIYSSTNRGGGGLVKLKVNGGNVELEPVYAAPRLPTSIGGAVLVDDYLYGTNSGGLMCVEFSTGTVKWQERGVGAASVCYADGRLYLHGENGQVALVEASPEGYREKGRLSPADPPERKMAQAWAYPAVANGKLYIRDLGTLWCYDVKAR